MDHIGLQVRCWRQYGTKTRFQVCRSGLVAASEESMPLGAAIEALYEDDEPSRPFARCAQSVTFKQTPPPSSQLREACGRGWRAWLGLGG